MGTIDIIYLIAVGITVCIGLFFAIRIFLKIRNNSIKDFKQRQQNNRNKIKYDRHN